MRENLRFLPAFVLAALDRLDYNRLYEIRLRADKPARVFYGSRFFYLTARGLSDSAEDAMTVTAGQISEAVLRAAEFSIYAVNNHLSQGFITISGGIRIGLAGEVVYEGEKIKTQKNFGSLVVRIPHEIKGCASAAYAALCAAADKNLLLISPPGCGKTTILRDLCRLVSDAGYNALLVDERNELAACRNGIPALDVGINTDVVCGAFKDYAFSFGIRSLRPDFIITDELAGKDDIEAARRAVLSGVNVIASVHAASLSDIRGKDELAGLLKGKIFGVYAFLSLRRGAGTYEAVLDADFKDMGEKPCGDNGRTNNLKSPLLAKSPFSASGHCDCGGYSDYNGKNCGNSACSHDGNSKDNFNHYIGGLKAADTSSGYKKYF